MLPWLNLLLPGSGLILRDRWLLGPLLLLTALAGLILAGGAGLVADSGYASSLRGLGLGIWLAMLLLAGSCWWLHERRRPTETEGARRLSRAASAAWLRNDPAAAREAVRTLCQQAPDEAGAWRLALLIGGQPTLERQARQRLARLAARGETSS